MPVGEDFRAAEMAWLHDHLQELEEQFAGRWVAIDGPELIAQADDLATVLHLSAQAGHPHPFVTVIPTGPQPPFVGCHA